MNVLERHRPILKFRVHRPDKTKAESVIMDVLVRRSLPPFPSTTRVCRLLLGQYRALLGKGVEWTSTSIYEEMAILANGNPYRHFFFYLICPQ